MRRMLTPLLGLALVAATAAPALGAGVQQNLEMEIDPATGPAGSTFTVSSVDECATKGPTAVDLTAPGAEPAAQTVETDGGTWEAEFTVPANAEPGDVIVVNATCRTDFEIVIDEARVQGVRAARGISPTILGTYTPVTFAVTGTVDTTTSSVPTTPTTEPPGTLPDSGVAPDVVSTPTLTG